MSTSAAHDAIPIPEWTLGDRLRKARRQVHLSQAEFADRLGENQKTYAAWELDTSFPRNVLTVAKRVEAMTGIPAGWVLGVLDYNRGGRVTEIDTGW
jgi:transcriptional regulator with XRE-family HTH domain